MSNQNKEIREKVTEIMEDATGLIDQYDNRGIYIDSIMFLIAQSNKELLDEIIEKLPKTNPDLNLADEREDTVYEEAISQVKQLLLDIRGKYNG